jgi:hypothetical protein
MGVLCAIGNSKFGGRSMKLAISLAAAGLALASAISDSEGIEVFQDVDADPRWTNTTVVSPLSLTSHYTATMATRQSA